jgi:hypothetical protein
MMKEGGSTPAPTLEPFGQVAVRKGYINQQQVTDALSRQKHITSSGFPHKLIGLIMLEMGVLGTTELIEVLREMNTPGASPRRIAPQN